jgi:phytol kinase
MGPVSFIRSSNLDLSLEGIFVRLTIMIFIFVSFLSAVFLMNIIDATKKKHVKYGIPILWIIATISILWLSLNPTLFVVNEKSSQISEEASTVRFTFGEYPNQDKLLQLKDEGYTSIVSLLHPAVVPFEPRLIEEEKQNVEYAGLEFIHIPMVPWVSENTDAVSKLKELAINGKGKYYIHCYLGKDRIRLARNVIEANSPLDAINGIVLETELIKTKANFERGKVIYLDKDVYVTPYPTDDEYIKYVIGDAKYVLSLLDPLNQEDLILINKEKDILNKYGVSYENYYISRTPFDSYAAYVSSKKAKSLPRPLFVHSFFSNSAVVDSFVQSYLTDKACTSYLLFYYPMQNGAVEFISPDVIIGPTPKEFEFNSYLYQNGVRRILYLGTEDSNESFTQKSYARASRLFWDISDNNISSIKRIVSKNGPWYIYGPKLDLIKEDLRNELGPAHFESTYLLEENPDIQKEENISVVGEPEKERFSISSFLHKAIPSIEDVILFTPPLALYVGVLMKIVGYIHTKKKIKTPYTRKIFHFSTFISAAIIQLIGGLSFVILYGIINSFFIFYVIYRNEELPFYQAIARTTDGVHKSKFILIPLIMTAFGGLIGNILFNGLAIIGYLIVGVGDAIGEPVGTKWGKHRYKVPSLFSVSVTRSIEGSISVAITSIAFAILGLSALGTPLSTALFLGFVCGIVAALTEAISNHGLDNLSVQLVPVAVIYIIMNIL